MDEQTLEKNDVLQELLKSEYDLAKHECEYYTQEFNKQDTVYGVYFAVFSVVIGAIYKIAETNNDQLELTNLAVILNQKIIIGGMILFLAFLLPPLILTNQGIARIDGSTLGILALCRHRTLDRRRKCFHLDRCVLRLQFWVDGM